MDKTFVRDPDEFPTRCPECRTKGQPVGSETLSAQLNLEIRMGLADSAYFCSDPYCEVVYFDDYAVTVKRDALNHLIPVKDAEAAICSCFGLRREDIERDVKEGGIQRTNATLEKAQSSAASCLTKSPNGRSCVPEIQCYYLKHKQRLEKAQEQQKPQS